MIIDIIVGLVLTYGCYTGFTSGLIKTVFTSMSIFIAIVASLILSNHMIEFLGAILNLNSGVNFILGFILTFVLVLALIRFAGNKLTEILKTIKLNFINQIAGGAFMGFFYALVLSYGLGLMSNLKLLSESQKQQSITYALLEPIPRVSQPIFDSLKPVFSDFWTKLVETMKQIDKKAEKLHNNDPNLQEG